MNTIYHRLIFLLFSSFFCVIPVTPANAREFLVMIQENKLTLKADNIAMELVLLEIERQSSIRMKFFLSQDDVISANLNSIPLDAGLALLMRNFNHSLVYRQINPNIPPVISSLFIYSRSDSSSLQLTWSQPQKGTSPATPPKNIPEFFTLPGAQNLHNTNPIDSNPLHSMMAIDPLARFGDRRPSYLPSPFEHDSGELSL